ncbi:MAG: 2-oxoglutarate dehydrogenase E1 component [Candidatus Latescibacterota bacterium]|nr:2-oxoglutarate dehydrogenase E1 component [Candidatus Latescibacterota bacterium]
MAGPDYSNIANAQYIDEMYKNYRTDPVSVTDDWRAFFQGFELGKQRADGAGGSDDSMSHGAHSLVTAYRRMGHLVSNLAPINYERPPHPLLDIAEYGFSESDLDTVVGNGGFLGPVDGTLKDLLAKLRNTYCRSIGVEFLEIPYKSQQDWLLQQMEPTLNRPMFTRAQSVQTFRQIVAAQSFESFLHTKFIGHKRFSLEGAESLIPLLITLADSGAGLGVDEMVAGMAHRGRLNVLANVMEKPYSQIFSEFEGTIPDQGVHGSGDVKYHLGYSNDHSTPDGESIHISLTPNPSHLELVNPVVEGIVFAKQEIKQDVQRGQVVPVLIHGDASFTGQGIIMETLCLCQLNGYDTGGTVHIIVNNQIGFTATPRQTRFTSYPSDVAKIIHTPIFHVNGDDPEAVVHAARMAMEFRQAFKSDVILDLWCYRRHGHNEGDDPVFTQPIRYREIANHSTVDKIYEKVLVEHGVLSQEDIDAIRADVRSELDEGLDQAHKKAPEESMDSFGGVWKGLDWAGGDWSADTSVDRETLVGIAEKATASPDDFTMYRKLERLVKSRRDMVVGDIPMDWGCAEMLGFGSLLIEGISVRLSGQDCQRGTFSHRHGVWHDYENGRQYWPLAHLSDDQGEFTLLNSMLSELAVVGFEYGISSADPWRLTMWEAQFGDFSNMAQPIIDQFISSAEQKWQRMSGLVMLLPHGYEGQGPEHSSARIERYLALCSQNNMQLAIPTLPAQYFHLLRRQMKRNFRKPLVLVMPKSLLRHKDSVSSLADLTDAQFSPILDDPEVRSVEKVTRLLFCSGKVYFDLQEERKVRDEEAVAVIRIEQLNPFPWAEVEDILARYDAVTEVFWVQEEPINMGSWDFTEPKLSRALRGRLPVQYAGRPPSASTATGVTQLHLDELKTYVGEAIGLNN